MAKLKMGQLKDRIMAQVICAQEKNIPSSMGVTRKHKLCQRVADLPQCGVGTEVSGATVPSVCNSVGCEFIAISSVF